MRYAAITVDPPWNFRTYSAKGEGRSAKQHYPCLSMDDIAELPVLSYAAENCALFLWTTDPMLPQALQMLKAWGFTYKTVGFYWAKTNKDGGFFTGMGYWTRANPEQCLLATRGAPKRIARDVPRLIVAPRREHSRKPDEFYKRVERLVAGPYLDMFAREQRPGWATWGDDVDHFSCATPEPPARSEDPAEQARQQQLETLTTFRCIASRRVR